MQYRRISVIGLGYIGLPTATMFANSGVDVIGVDVTARIVDTINSGRAHFGEPDLDALLDKAVKAGKLRATLKPEPAEAFIIAVPTPFKNDKQPDLSYIEAAGKSIAPVLAKGNLVVLESTSPVGATEQLTAWLAAARPDLKFAGPGVDAPDIHMTYCPERVLPGKIIQELVENARTVGGITPDCAARAAALYQIFVKAECRTTTARTAEMAKLTENSFRDVNIAFANELSIICDRLGIDVWELRKIANLHPRVNILEPGAGVGGHCIAVDPWFIVAAAPDEARLIRTAREVNDHKPHFIIEKVQAACAQLGRNPTIACFGLAYKPDVDDLRESPAIEIVATLAAKKMGTILAVEPHVETLPGTLTQAGVEHVTQEEALTRADVLVLLVDHTPFRHIAPPLRHGKIVVDARGIW